MDALEEFLVDEDIFYVGLDRLQYLSCRCCSRFTPFLLYLPPHDEIQRIVCGLQKDQLLFCPGCIPKRQDLLQIYPLVGESVLCDVALLEALRGFEYSNPFYRKYARLPRTLITIETRLNGGLPAFDMRMKERFEALRKLFASVHLLDNRKYSGLQEIGAVLTAKAAEIRQFYGQSELLRSPSKSSPEVVEQIDVDCEIPSNEIEVIETQQTLPCDAGSSQVESSQFNATLQPYVAVDKRFKLKVLSSKTAFPCDICLLTEKNGLRYGEFLEKEQKKDTFRCHYFCLLSGTHIVQNGRDSSGILGFLLKDIIDSFKMYRQNKCSYCGQLSAAILCSEQGCSRQFHYICGYKNNCLTQFTGAFQSYCHEHHSVNHTLKHVDEQECWICKEEMGPHNPVSSVCSFCPPEDETGETEIAWYHRKCLQRYAFEAGYYFMCPNCQEAKEFTEYAKQHGIFVPMRDATWEREKYAYKDIHKSNCCAEVCKVVVRSKASVKGRELVGCKACGGATMHMICAELDDPSDYVCSDCLDATFIKLF